MKTILHPISYLLTPVLLICTFFIYSIEAFENISPNKSNQICSVELEALMDSLARNLGNSAGYKERKFLSILEQPLISEGTLHFSPPDYLEKIITKPQKERLVVESEILKIFDQQDNFRTFSLDDYPPLKELLNGIRFTLLGNLNDLKEYYELDLHGNCDQWSLTLVPKTTSAMDIIDRIIFLGAKGKIQKITWVETNGDFTVMTIIKEKS